MAKLFLSLLSVSLILLSLDSCYYDKADVLLGDVNCDTTAYTYSNQVEPIISQYCISCHNTNNASGNVNLDNYQSVAIYAANGELSCVINHENGCSPMPKNGAQLNICDRTIIDIWVADGYPDN
jgi:hypothetical protein